MLRYPEQKYYEEFWIKLQINPIEPDKTQPKRNKKTQRSTVHIEIHYFFAYWTIYLPITAHLNMVYSNPQHVGFKKKVYKQISYCHCTRFYLFVASMLELYLIQYLKTVMSETWQGDPPRCCRWKRCSHCCCLHAKPLSVRPFWLARAVLFSAKLHKSPF